MLLHNGNEILSFPSVGHAVYMREPYFNMKLLLKSSNYKDYGSKRNCHLTMDATGIHKVLLLSL